MEGEIAHGIGGGDRIGIGFEEGIDNVGCGLEGGGCVEGEVAAVVGEGGFFGELGSLDCFVWG